MSAACYTFCFHPTWKKCRKTSPPASHMGLSTSTSGNCTPCDLTKVEVQTFFQSTFIEHQGQSRTLAGHWAYKYNQDSHVSCSWCKVGERQVNHAEHYRLQVLAHKAQRMGTGEEQPFLILQSGKLQRRGESSISLKKEAGIDQANGSWEEFPGEEAVSEIKCLSILRKLKIT